MLLLVRFTWTLADRAGASCPVLGSKLTPRFGLTETSQLPERQLAPAKRVVPMAPMPAICVAGSFRLA